MIYLKNKFDLPDNLDVQRININMSIIEAILVLELVYWTYKILID